MDSVIAKNQSHTVSMYWLVSIVPGSPVSNLLALFDLQPTRLDPNNRGPSGGRFSRRYGKFPVSGSLGLASSRSPPVQSASGSPGSAREKARGKARPDQP